jgi:hypothetical protein
MGWRHRIREAYGRYERFVPVAFFVGGIAFDLVTLGRIDSRVGLATQAAYLAMIAFLVSLEVLDLHGVLAPGPRLRKFWPHREEAVHFLFGSLLSSFAIFYFLSMSFIASFSFFLIIASLLVANELPRFRRLGTLIRFALLALCSASYLSYLVPILWGSVGAPQFLTALALAGLLQLAIAKSMGLRVKDNAFLRREVTLPGAAVLLLLLLLYFLKVIPPVPLSLKEVGIYHRVEKVEDAYILAHERPRWEFWHTGDQNFKARSGDAIYCFFRIFSPSGFADQVRVRWLYKDPQRGWTSSDSVPVTIAGGRAEGYRGFTFKRNYQPGRWQVRIETADEREIGRIYLTVAADDGTDDRLFRHDLSR